MSNNFSVLSLNLKQYFDNFSAAISLVTNIETLNLGISIVLSVFLLASIITVLNYLLKINCNCN